MKNKKVKIGIVGLGAVSKNIHIPVLCTFRDIKIAAAAEMDIQKARKICAKWNIPRVYKNFSEMYESSDLDAVFICIPNSLHYDAVRTALLHNLHVFCEKPMGLCSKKAYKLVKMAEEKNRVLAVGYNRRLSQTYQRASLIVKSPSTLGTILQLHATLVNPGPYIGWIPSTDWFYEERNGGVLYDSGSHLFDLVAYILHDKITEVLAKAISTMRGVHVSDTIVGVFKTESGIIGSFNIGWRTAVCYDSIEIHGTAGSLLVNPFELEEIYAHHNVLNKLINHIRFAKNVLKWGINSASSSKKPDETYFKEDRRFIDAIAKNKQPYVSGREAKYVVEILEAIKKSLERDSWIKVECRR